MRLRDELERSVRSIVERDPRVAEGGFFGIVLGSGLGDFTDALEDRIDVPFSKIANFTDCSVAGHRGTVCIGYLEGTLVVALRGRIHSYEGHSARAVVQGVRTLVAAGASSIVLTNAAGGLRPHLQVGDLMILRDHINLTGRNPLIDDGVTELGPRFPDMTIAYDPALRDAMLAAGRSQGLPVSSGIYCAVLGPSYETPSEVRMIGRMGGDVIGMSTVLEAIAVRHMGSCRMGGISVVSNAAAGTGEPGQVLDHSDVSEVSGKAGERLTTLIRTLLSRRDEWWDPR
jgi:purine-nucleoside phosphorylase